MKQPLFVALQGYGLFPIFGTDTVIFKPLCILQLCIGGRAFYHQFAEGIAYYYVSVHGLELRIFVIGAESGNVDAVGILGNSVHKVLAREGVLGLGVVLGASCATANADDLGLYDAEKHVV